MEQTIAYDPDRGVFTVADKHGSSVYLRQSGGTGLPAFALSEDGEQILDYFQIDLSDKVKDGMPNHVLVFGRNAYWPTQCD